MDLNKLYIECNYLFAYLFNYLHKYSLCKGKSMENYTKRKLKEVVRGLIGDGFSGTQSELVKLLKQRGFNVTQSTISRMMSEMGIIRDWRVTL